jgi:hypothetical protein
MFFVDLRSMFHDFSRHAAWNASVSHDEAASHWAIPSAWSRSCSSWDFWGWYWYLENDYEIVMKVYWWYTIYSHSHYHDYLGMILIWDSNESIIIISMIIFWVILILSLIW